MQFASDHHPVPYINNGQYGRMGGGGTCMLFIYMHSSFQVNLIHVASTCKNAADEKLRQSIRRFADIHGSPAAIILISGDTNFAADLNDLRHRYCVCNRELDTLWCNLFLFSGCGTLVSFHVK
jgi:hypothetical protein